MRHTHTRQTRRSTRLTTAPLVPRTFAIERNSGARRERRTTVAQPAARRPQPHACLGNKAACQRHGLLPRVPAAAHTHLGRRPAQTMARAPTARRITHSTRWQSTRRLSAHPPVCLITTQSPPAVALVPRANAAGLVQHPAIRSTPEPTPAAHPSHPHRRVGAARARASSRVSAAPNMHILEWPVAGPWQHPEPVVRVKAAGGARCSLVRTPRLWRLSPGRA